MEKRLLGVGVGGLVVVGDSSVVGVLWRGRIVPMVAEAALGVSGGECDGVGGEGVFVEGIVPLLRVE